MKVIQHTLVEDQYNFYIKHLEIVSCLLPTNLTRKEIEVLAAFMSLDKDLTEGDMFNSVARKRVMSKLGLVPGGLGNHLRHMTDKEVLYRDEKTNKLKIQSYLVVENSAQGYQIKLVKNEKTTE